MLLVKCKKERQLRSKLIKYVVYVNGVMSGLLKVKYLRINVIFKNAIN